MDILKRNLAPVSQAGWSVIDEVARDTLKANLSARKFADINGPHGIGYTCVSLGRLALGSQQDKSGVQYGTYMVQPLVESRMNFSLKTWELDNIERGAKDIQLDSLTEAAKNMAAFEENAVYSGFKPGSIKGLRESAKGPIIALKPEPDSIMDAVLEGQARIIAEGIESPFSLVVSKALWKVLGRPAPGGSLRELIERQLGGSVIYSDFTDGAILASVRGGDFELVLGQDLSIGYHHHTSEEIFMFITESFTFRVITPEALVLFSV